MSDTVLVSADQKIVVVHVPLRHRRHGGRKLMIATAATPKRSAAIKTDDTILKALGRAYRWKRMLESGEFTSITDLARAEKINHAYVRRILRLTLLSPKITEAILDGRQPKHVQLQDLLRRFPLWWSEQRQQFLA